MLSPIELLKRIDIKSLLAWLWRRPNPHDLRLFGLALIAISALTLPVISVARWSVDDYGRSMLGYNDLVPAGRPVAAVILWLINVGSLTDTAPLPQLIAVIFLALTTLVIGRRFSISEPVTIFLLAAGIAGNPYFVENISFRFDAAPMALAILLSACALPAVHSRTTVISTALSTTFLLLALCTYQYSANFYFVMASFSIGLRILSENSSMLWKDVCACYLPAVVAGALYTPLFQYLTMLDGHEYALPTVLAAHYVAQQSQIAGILEWPGTMLHNVARASSILYSDWRNTFLGTVWAVNFLIMASTYGRLIAIRASGIRAAVAIVLLCSSILGVIGIQLPLPATEFIARSLVGWGALLAMPPIALGFSKPVLLRTFAISLLAVQAVATMSLTYTLRNALANQQEYEQRVVSDVANEISAAAVTHPIRHLGVSGYLEAPTAVARASMKYPVIQRLAYATLYDGFWAPFRLQWSGASLDFADMQSTQKRDIICKTSPSAIGTGYVLFIVNDTALLRFKTDGIACDGR